MSAKFIVQLELPETLVSKLATYSFTHQDEWMLYANSTKILPDKLAKFMSDLLNRKIRSLEPNSTYELVRDLPESSRKLLISNLGVDMRKLRGLSTFEMIRRIEEENNAVVIFTHFDDRYQAHMVPRKPR